MTQHDNILYKALLTRDSRYDGQLFFAVITTGIFCRPICPAPKPKPQNVLYFSSAEMAQEAGFRPCKRCRPETRMGSAAWKGTIATIERAVRLLASADEPESIPQLAEKLGVTDRHLRRLFMQHLGHPPSRIRAENRLDIAKSLLINSDETITAIAYAAGYRSLRRFHASFKEATGLSPSHWREHHAHEL